jgi:hypothetical protein
MGYEWMAGKRVWSFGMGFDECDGRLARFVGRSETMAWVGKGPKQRSRWKTKTSLSTSFFFQNR